MAAKKVLILGGGAGGVVAARRLREVLKPEEVEITVIDKSEFHEFRPSYLWVMTGIREPDDVRRPLKALEKYGIRYVQDNVVEIDPANRAVKGEKGSYDYDYLVVALGAALKEDIEAPGVCAPWSMEGALRCRSILSEVRSPSAKIVIGPASWPYRCPPAPFEVAFLLKYLMEQRGVKADIKVFHVWGRPMEPFGPLMSSMFSQMLNQYGIEFVGGAQFQEVDGASRRVRLSTGDLEYDVAVVIPPHAPPAPVAKSELADPQTGWMKVEIPHMRNPKYKEVFGVGDVVAPTIGLGMAGVFAHFQAEHVASQIADEVKGVYMGEHYNMSGVCVMDLGYMGAAVYCDFSKKLVEGAPYPDCRMLGVSRAFRIIKAAFERMWFSSLFGY
ncbi:MAG: FAD/NAD(P)-binding oxidoreductase [Thermoproteota archaeon]